MTRQDELNDAWCKYMNKCSTEIMQALAFALRWCDQHPHWISVEDYSKDELPPLIDKNNPYGESVQVLFVIVLINGAQFINKGTFDYATGVWHSLDMQCSFCKENVTHWMPMPAPPHIIDANKKEVDRIIGIADHIKTALDVLNKKGDEK